MKNEIMKFSGKWLGLESIASHVSLVQNAVSPNYPGSEGQALCGS